MYKFVRFWGEMDSVLSLKKIKQPAKTMHRSNRRLSFCNMSQKSENLYFEIKPKNTFSLGARELWTYRELCFFFVWRDIKVKYKQAVLGILWVILQPIAMMLIFTAIFSKGMNVSSDGIPYPIFALSGLLIWNIFSNGLQNAASSMVTNSNIIKKIYFPRLVIPISAVLTALVDFLVALLLLIAVVPFFDCPFYLLKFVFYLPLSLILCLVTTLGLGTFLAAFNVKYRDFQYILPFAIQFLLFVNPVLYSPTIFQSPTLRMLMQLNPIATSIRLLRTCFSEEILSASEILSSFSVAFFIFVVGIVVFRKTESYFADLA